MKLPNCGQWWARNKPASLQAVTVPDPTSEVGYREIVAGSAD